MNKLGAIGFETRSASGAGIITLSGGVSFSTSVPPDSRSLRSLDFRADEWLWPWYTGSVATSTPNEPSGTRWGWHHQELNGTIANDFRFRGVARNGTEVLSLSREASTSLLTLRVGGVVVQTSAYIVSAFEWERMIVDVDNQVGGDVNVYADGDLSAPILTYTLLSSLPNPNQFIGSGPNSSGCLVDDMVAWEFGAGSYPDDLAEFISSSIELHVPIGAGNYSDWGDGAGGTGTFDLIDEVPFDDLDFIDATAVDEVSTFEMSDTAEDRVQYATAFMRVTRVGTAAGSTMQLRQRLGTTDDDQPSTSTGAPGDGYVVVPLQYDADGNNWTSANWNATELGPVART